MSTSSLKTLLDVTSASDKSLSSNSHSDEYASPNSVIFIKPEKKQTMDNYNELDLNDLISDQEQDFDALRRHAEAISQLIKDKKSASALLNRADYIRVTWTTCQNRNAWIFRTATDEDKGQIKYFTEKQLSSMETIVFEALDAVADYSSSLLPPSPGVTGQQHQVVDSNVRLERLQLGKFSGNFIEWQSYRDMFNSLVIKNRSFDNFVKMTYLRNSLEGEALDAIGHMEITESNFEVAWDILQKQYNNKIALTNAHLTALLSLEPIKKESATGLRSLRTTMTKHLGALKSLGRNVEGYSDIMINRVSNLLDGQTKRDWELSLASRTDFPTLEELDHFLIDRIQVLTNLKAPVIANTSTSLPSKGKQQSPFIKSHFTIASDIKCPICKENHPIYKCKTFKSKTADDRLDVVKSYKLCTNCLSSRHSTRDCNSNNTCFKCQKRHHTSLHRPHQQAASIPENATSSESSSSGMEVRSHFTFSKVLNHSHILLAIARVWVLAPNGRAIRVRALIDPCATWTFMSRELSSTLGVKSYRVSASISGVGISNPITTSSAANIRISPTSQGEQCLETAALILPKISTYIPNCKGNVQSWPHLKGLDLADNPLSNDPIHLLIGANLYGAVLLDGVKKGKSLNDPIAQNTIFGWIISGSTDINQTQIGKSITVNHCVTNKSLNDSLQKFWKIEEIPETRFLTIDDELCEEHFRQTHSRTADGRYMVRLPFKSDAPINIGDSRHIAEISLKRIESRLSKNEIHHKLYSSFMSEFESLNHMERVETQDSLYKPVYLPHHPVFREHSQTTKLRVVFNASAKTSNNTSLNDHLHTGPALQSDLARIITNWRTHKFVYTADIAKMYRQILVNPLDTDYQRILWRESPDMPIDVFRILRLTYGERPAPYLAIRVIHQLVADEGKPFPIASKILLEDTFVDDIFFGAHTLELARVTRQEVITLLGKAQLHARKWMSNDSDLLEGIDPEDHGLAWTAQSSDHEALKVLGLSWNPSTDSFNFKVSFELPRNFTKRVVVSLIAKLFDPIGWISPVIIVGKLFIQQLWRDAYSWDEILPDSLVQSLQLYFSALQNLDKISIPRWVGHAPELNEAELHGFSDASENAYGAAIYLRVVSQTGQVTVSLLTSKTKVAPIKQLCIPRLELQAATLLARLMVSTRKSRELSDLQFQCWTDADIVLAWLKKHASTWQTFVANRVSEIHTLLPDHHWRHVCSSDNPADILSRGKSASDLAQSSLWWSGPTWLQESKEKWPKTKESVPSEANLERKRHNIEVNLKVVQEPHPLAQLIEECSTWHKLLRVTAMVVVFIKKYIERLKLLKSSKILSQNIKNQRVERTSTVVSAADVCMAENLIIAYTQNLLFADELNALKNSKPISSNSKLQALSPYLENNIIRVGGRLSFSELAHSEKHPIVLSKHRVSSLIIEAAHKRCLHGGVRLTLFTVRQKYWILHPRPQVKSVIYNCVSCAKLRAKPVTQLMADLPQQRVTRPPRPFFDCGVDYAGPLQVRMTSGRGSKSHPCYIAVFVCFAVKAIHLEVVTDYTSTAFIAAFKRFVARRGLPRLMKSDQGTTFKGADRELQEAFKGAVASAEFQNLLANDRVSWQFNPPAAPHFGGLWEAGVCSVKGHLKRILLDKTPTLEELMTLLCQIEAVLNSRPLGPLTDDIDEYQALTPGHFLIGGKLTAIPEPSVVNLSSNSLNRWSQFQQCLEIFWRKWSSDYLQSLQHRSKWRIEQDNIKVGQLVMINQPNLPPTKWPLGRVIETIVSPDKKIRTVRVKTANSTFVRPIAKIALLPVNLYENCTIVSTVSGAI